MNASEIYLSLFDADVPIPELRDGLLLLSEKVSEDADRLLKLKNKKRAGDLLTISIRLAEKLDQVDRLPLLLIKQFYAQGMRGQSQQAYAYLEEVFDRLEQSGGVDVGEKIGDLLLQLEPDVTAIQSLTGLLQRYDPGQNHPERRAEAEAACRKLSSMLEPG